MKLSIIIPAYNAEDYIEFCLNSCLNQDLDSSEYEIIVIDDGSTDNTAKKILPFTKIHSNIILKTQENKGNGATRNIGVTVSKGNYIYFLDADDYLATNTLGTIIKLQEQYSLDMIVFSSKNVKDDHQLISKHFSSDIKITNILNGVDYLGAYNYSPEVWRYVIRKNFYLNSELSFYDKKFVQDSYFTPHLISKTNRISYLNYDVHRYRKSKNSITRNNSINHFKIHFNDMCFSVDRLHLLKKDLIKNGVTNNNALQRLHIKQQQYVFIIILRLIKSQLKISELKNILSDFRTIDAYPLDKYLSSLNHKKMLHIILTLIFNRQYLLYPSIKTYRLLRAINIS